MTVPNIVFFDLDETLIQNTSDFPTILTSILSAHFPQIEADRKKRFMISLREGADANWKNMFSVAEGEPIASNWFGDAFASIGEPVNHGELFAEQFVALASSSTCVMEQAVETLQFIKSLGINIGVITNGFTRLQFAKLEKNRLMDLIDYPVASQQAGAHKPSPIVFEFALKSANSSARNAWHVGDHLVNDIEGAKKAGMKAVLFDPKRENTKAEFNSEADHCIAHFAELQMLINNAF